MKHFYTFLVVLLIGNLGFGQQNIDNVDSDGADINTTPSGTTDDIIAERNDELVFIKLRASANSNSYGTDIYFNDNASLGFDLGYDAAIFGIVPNFALYSQLVQDNTGLDLSLALQAVNSTDISNVNIPLGVNANQGEQLTFSISNSTLPETTNVYLDDTVANTSTLLTNSDHVFTPATALSGTGRFFLRISEPSITYTYNGSWSPSDPNGIAAAGDDIVIASGNAIIDTNTTCNSVTVNPGAGLTVNADVTLNTNGLTLESSSTSYSSLIRNGSITGTLNYERHVNENGSGSTGSNDLVAAPLHGQAFNTFAAANPNILNNGTLYLFGPFDKSLSAYVNYAATETATLDAGVGYRAGTTDNGTVTFTGTDTNVVVSHDIINSAGTNNPEWNLVGNPYPSYLNFQQFFLHDVGGVLNFQLFDAGSAAIYGYDGSALNGWTIYNSATTTASTVLAPGQGFFVSADATNAPLYNLEFTPAMRSMGSGDDFIVGRNAELSYVQIKASTNTDSFGTDIYFNNQASLGFDLGYDAAVWGEVTPDFAIYSHLVQDNVGKAMALQAVNSTNLSDVVIPLGVNANQGEQLTFSIADTTLPASVSVYLEDAVANTSTRLNEGDYIITPVEALSGTGRFFLRTSEDALSSKNNNLDTLNIFTLINSKELVVSGTLKENTMLNLYNIDGRLVLRTQLDNTLLQNSIDVSSISGGVYIVNVQNRTQQISQKVIIK
ncbi:T9SS type A sorting domain-containing protein [Psychroserpens jangbogonensis]|uniref:T9SS type A sorting domain-containing protein n=1 Tax=Psychroserpens jangbogonensis TaxID=1484460 RepID=UPI00053DF83C|nr:T9SS type A sorting domain-containing protein [Psychroserpens jangbogonensis]